MRILVPYTPVTLTDTNVGSSSLDEWNDASIPYAVGDQIKLTSGYSLPLRQYECIQDHTSADAKKPVMGGNAYWADIGAINQHRMFDGTNTLQTIADDISGNIVVEIRVTTRLQTLVLLGLSDVTQARVVETVNGVDVADTTYDLITVQTPVGYWSHYFGDRVYTNSLVHNMYGMAVSPTLTITLTGAGSAKCAQCLPCKAIDLGKTEWGASPRIKSWSTWDEDEYLGYKFVPRKTTRQGNYTLWVDTHQFDRVYNLIESLERKLVVLDANNVDTNYDSIRAFGKITDFSTSGLEYAKTAIDIKIDGAG